MSLFYILRSRLLYFLKRKSMKKILIAIFPLVLISCGESPSPVVQNVVEIPEIRELTPQSTQASDQIDDAPQTEQEEQDVEEITEVPSLRELPAPSEPVFGEIPLPFSHDFDKDRALPFLGGTFFDLDGDNKKEFIITG